MGGLPQKARHRRFKVEKEGSIFSDNKEKEIAPCPGNFRVLLKDNFRITFIRIRPVEDGAELVDGYESSYTK